MQATVAASPRNAKYAAAVDRESAREMLAAKLEAGAAEGGRREGRRRAGQGRRQDQAEGVGAEAGSSRRRTKEEEGVVTQVVKSGAFKQFMRTAAAEIARGLFGTGRRR